MAPAEVCILGLGLMGTEMALRLREQGHDVVVWNRSAAKAQAVADKAAAGQCIVAETAVEALSKCSDSALALVVLTDIAAVLSLVRSAGFGIALRGRTLVNLTSGNADDARAVAQAVEEASEGGAKLLDGAYCGNPTKARAGAGQLFLSSKPEHAASAAGQALLEELGSVTLCGGIGASRAMDYAVVDLFFACVLSFMSNAASLEREGVDVKQFASEAAKRLATVPGALEMYSERMASRDEAAYRANPTVSLATARSYWASRLPYNQDHGIPSDFTNFYMELLEKAAGAAPGGSGGPNAEADLSRLQEVVRYGSSSSAAGGADEGPLAKEAGEQ
mmetsp:Transcript_113757/g.332231  ORF Transcript_113757/g.332231 Transcript_113757/m.332231 type:complete len:334 (+) Transcript_113757:83-1084(+)